MNLTKEQLIELSVTEFGFDRERVENWLADGTWQIRDNAIWTRCECGRDNCQYCKEQRDNTEVYPMIVVYLPKRD